MAATPKQVSDFISSSAPFDLLASSEVTYLADHATIIYLTQNNKQTVLADHLESVFLVQSGQYSVKDSDIESRQVGEADFFGLKRLIEGVHYKLEITVDKPGLVYCWPQSVMSNVLKHQSVQQFFQHLVTDTLKNSAASQNQSRWLYMPISDVLTQSAICTTEEAPIFDVAQLMTKKNVSSILVAKRVNDEQVLTGIVTDKDIRVRAVAEQMPLQSAIKSIMTNDPITVVPSQTLFDALALINEHHIQHLPVVDEVSHKPLGMICSSDVVRQQGGNLQFLVTELARAKSELELIKTSRKIPQYMGNFAKRPGDFDIAGKVLSQATDLMTRKLISFFEKQHGQAPMGFCWIAFGSQAREEQNLGSDQDNALLLHSQPNLEQSEYFAGMTAYVCEGLHKCGIKLCPGNIMASNPALRLSTTQAIEQTLAWVQEPTEQALMRFNIYLDVRAVAGDATLLEDVHAKRKAPLQNQLFLLALAKQCYQSRVPLTFFNQFEFEEGHSIDDGVDLKKRGVAIVNSLARLYALESGLSTPLTLQRLSQLPQTSSLSQHDADSLRDIWLFLNRLRWQHQITQHKTDNLISLSELSSIETHQLKASLQFIERCQKAALHTFTRGIA
ncbi:CBS domain-containing protein [Glaciecola sp. XM2]|uniref:DUF294 nucleotidyltransferase-like domain-containing protein n=1 Tax=Glaciecola sp. XM2 TaxID=1914931 RepID=UPI001BDE70E3|nr:CBS domain-containing protein [Glaciecola sp. XM2]